jgi:hypothetical protein
MSVGINFRFLKLNKLQAITLSREIEGASYSALDDTQHFVGSVPLVENKFDDINHFFIRQKIAMEDCDLLINSAPLANSTEFTVPIRVNQFLKGIDCKLTLTCSD